MLPFDIWLLFFRSATLVLDEDGQGSSQCFQIMANSSPGQLRELRYGKAGVRVTVGASMGIVFFDPQEICGVDLYA